MYVWKNSQTWTMKMFLAIPASLGLAESAEASSRTGWSRGGEGPSSSWGALLSDFLFSVLVGCFPWDRKIQAYGLQQHANIKKEL